MITCPPRGPRPALPATWLKSWKVRSLARKSGAGKSTMINLLARFYLVQEGSIEIDGVDIRKINLEDLRRQIGMVPQESYLFSGTIYDNIAYSKPNATLEQVIRAAKAANAHDFIVNFPDGYETQVGERGQGLSGGEKQRIAIARAILHDPKILILDDSTSACDVATEARIQDAINGRFAGVTKLLIAQRISTVISADRIILLENGRIIATGRHEDLLESSPQYKEIYDSQLGKGIVGGKET